MFFPIACLNLHYHDLWIVLGAKWTIMNVLLFNVAYCTIVSGRACIVYEVQSLLGRLVRLISTWEKDGVRDVMEMYLKQRETSSGTCFGEASPTPGMRPVRMLEWNATSNKSPAGNFECRGGKPGRRDSWGMKDGGGPGLRPCTEEGICNDQPETLSSPRRLRTGNGRPSWGWLHRRE